VHKLLQQENETVQQIETQMPVESVVTILDRYLSQLLIAATNKTTAYINHVKILSTNNKKFPL